MLDRRLVIIARWSSSVPCCWPCCCCCPAIFSLFIKLMHFKIFTTFDVSTLTRKSEMMSWCNFPFHFIYFLVHTKHSMNMYVWPKEKIYFFPFITQKMYKGMHKKFFSFIKTSIVLAHLKKKNMYVYILINHNSRVIRMQTQVFLVNAETIDVCNFYDVNVRCN